MSKRLTESVKLIEKAYRRKMKKERWEQTAPSFKNLNIDNRYRKGYENIKLLVTDLLDPEDTRAITAKISSISAYGSNYIITNIQCPFCGKHPKLNKHWNSYICDGEGHSKKVFEIKEVAHPKSKKVVELPVDEYE